MSKYMSMKHLKFVLYDLLDVEQLCKLDRHKDYDRDNFDMLLSAVKDFADQEMFPVLKEMDEKPAYLENGKIIVHPAVGKLMKFAGESGSIGSTFDFEDGGMQLPNVIHSCMAHIAQSANNHLPGYTGLTGGSAELIVDYGSDELKQTYVPNMMSGKWGGTMCLTEPQAGSSLSDINTTAYPQEDGSFKIKGQKIFISGGDHEYCENIVHLALGRIDGAPAGTKGISLFVIPKKRPSADGPLEDNDVSTAGEFQKMGQKGYCTAHLIFGEKDDCKAWIVGAPNKGLKYMFLMMNGARIDVGLTAASVASAAYYASLQYAKERPQGRRILAGGKKNVEESQTLIINHPDVKRMLLLQKSVVEGSLTLLLRASFYEDMSVAGPESERGHYHDLLEMLTPIAKTYPSEMGQQSVSTGLQVLGGYGFCKDFPLELYYRDIRIMALYEGTTGIQSLDLLGRKVVMKNGDAMRALTTEIIKSIKTASEHEELESYAQSLKEASKNLEEVIMHLLQYAMSGAHERYIADATIFMEMMSTIVIAWQWLDLARTALIAQKTSNMEFEHSFYQEKIHTMKYYFKYELPKIYACKRTLMNKDSLTLVEDMNFEMS